MKINKYYLQLTIIINKITYNIFLFTILFVIININIFLSL